MIARRIFPIIASTLVLALASSASADEPGKQGVATDIEIVSPSADTYLQYHGKLIVTLTGGFDEYRWGGASCGSRTMSAENVAALVRAVDQALLITPSWQMGQGSAKCLVGFTLEKSGR